MPNKITDDEIIKALEWCIEMECSKCPMNYDDCEERDFDNLVKRAIPIFNRQKAEIERLNTIIAETDKDKCNLIQAIPYIYKVKHEAVKEFAERLKQKIDGEDTVNTYWLCGYIGYLLREMVGENDDKG